MQIISVGHIAVIKNGDKVSTSGRGAGLRTGTASRSGEKHTVKPHKPIQWREGEEYEAAPTIRVPSTEKRLANWSLGSNSPWNSH